VTNSGFQTLASVRHYIHFRIKISGITSVEGNTKNQFKWVLTSTMSTTPLLENIPPQTPPLQLKPSPSSSPTSLQQTLHDFSK